MPTNPSGSPAPALTSLSTPPQTSDIVNFDTRADTHVTEMQTMVTQLIAQLVWIYNTCVTCYNNTVESFNSATASAASATASAASASAAALSTSVSVWVTSTVYALYVVVISPTDLQNYRRSISSGAATTIDPASDTAGWKMINYIKPFVVKTANYTAVNGDRLMANTTGGSFTITLPASPAAGWRITIKDYLNTFATNKLTIASASDNIEGVLASMDITNKGQGVTLEYVDATVGWKAI